MKAQALFAALLIILISPAVFAFGNSFTYQGKLVDGSAPADGSYDLQFTLQTSAGIPIGAVIVKDDVLVSDGVFSVELDFGPVIAVDDYQLQIGVRAGASSGAFTGLSPATKITPAPQAQIAELAQVATSVMDNSIGSAQIITNQVQSRVTSSCPVGQSIRVVNANGSVTCESAGAGPVGPQGPAGATGPAGPAGIAGPMGTAGAPGSADAWGRLGTAGTNADNNFIGTTDAQPFVVRTQNVQSLRIEPSTILFNGMPITANVIAGSSVNGALAGVRGATIAGGGGLGNSDPDVSLAGPNQVTDAYGTVGGGLTNQAGNGAGDTLDSAFATVAGGYRNTARGLQSTVGGGRGSDATGAYSTVGGGDQNTAGSTYDTVGGGRSNLTSGPSATISGGQGNHATGASSAVGGGILNDATGGSSTVSGGFSNCAGGDYSWAGGRRAEVRSGNQPDDRPCVANSGDADGDNGTFVWSDGRDLDFISTGPNQFLVRAQGGMAINTNVPTPGSALTVNGNMSFGAQSQQMLNLYNSDFGIGVQTNRLYFRTNSGFSWFEDGAHSDTTDDPGAGGTLHMRLSTTGQLQTTTGTISTLSDARLKDQVEDYTHALDQISALRPVRYHYRDAGKAAFQAEGMHLGFLAQEVQQVFPEWVSEGEDGYLMLSMRGFEAVAVRAIQELSAQNELLREKLATDTGALEAKIAAQEQRLTLQGAEFQARLDALEAKLIEP